MMPMIDTWLIDVAQNHRYHAKSFTVVILPAKDKVLNAAVEMSVSLFCQICFL